MSEPKFDLFKLTTASRRRLDSKAFSSPNDYFREIRINQMLTETIGRVSAIAMQLQDPERKVIEALRDCGTMIYSPIYDFMRVQRRAKEDVMRETMLTLYSLGDLLDQCFEGDAVLEMEEVEDVTGYARGGIDLIRSLIRGQYILTGDEFYDNLQIRLDVHREQTEKVSS